MKLPKFRSLRSLALLAVVASTGSVAAAQELSYLRGYGHVRANIGVQRAVFECETDDKADMLLGKLLADLFWDAGAEVKTTKVNARGHIVTIRTWAPYGSIAVLRNGHYVIAVGADDEQKLAARLGDEADALNGTPVSEPVKPYPRYLDYYDLRAVKAYTYAMLGNAGYPVESHWPFLKKFGLNIAFQALNARQSPAPGVFEFAPIDYEFQVANQNDGLASVGLTGGGEVPLWVYNRMPFQMVQPSPTTLLSNFLSTGGTGAHYESWGLTPSERALGTQIFMQKAMQRYSNDPALGAWQLYGGSPGAEIGFHDRYTEYLDYSVSGENSFRNWLQNNRHYNLTTLGQRWYGDPGKYSSWDEVKIPDVNGFFGTLGKGTLLLDSGWQLSSARDGIEVPPPAGDPSWLTVDMPPSQQRMLLPAGESFYRLEFNPQSWSTSSQVWLVCDPFVRSAKKVEVWLNREKIGEGLSNDTGFAIDLVGKLKPGANELIIRVPRGTAETPGASTYTEGRLIGPVFLSHTKPLAYPNLGPLDNARAADVHEWQAQAVEDSHLGLMNIAMAIDSNHPMILSGGAGLLGDKVSELAERYGTGLQFTGREGYYNPWWSGVGLLGGFYGTSEESAQTPAPLLTRELGWILFDADSNHCMFLNLDLYQKEEQATGWFTKHKRALQMIGKYVRVMPQMAIFVSSRDERSGSREPYNMDIGRGDLQAAHFDNAYATETQLLNGEVDKCPFLIDDGTDTMDQETLNAVRRYVENGGTFIALNQSGTHDPVMGDQQPLSVLTGMIAKPHPSAPLRFTGDGPALKTWQNKVVDSKGNFFVPANPSNIVPGAETKSLASFSDGKVAITSRQIGKGRIIQLGAVFWRDQGDKENEFLNQFLTDLGVRRNADASNSKVWVRKATMKNGLQDVLIAFNNDEKGPETAEVKIAEDQKPDQVIDEMSGQPVPFTYSGGWVSIANVSLDASETRIYAVKRADLANALGAWWAEKKTYWKMPPAATSPEVEALRQQLTASQADLNDPDVIAFSQWKFIADRAGTLANSPTWTKPEFDDAQWTRSGSQPWNVFEPKLADWQGAGLYRAGFAIPSEWAGRKIILNLNSYDLPIAYDQAQFYVNGTKVSDYQGHRGYQSYAFDVTNLVKPTGNVLSVKVVGGKSLSGLIGAVWLQPELKLNGLIDLSGPWQANGADFKPGADVTLPGKPVARSLSRVIDLPTGWMGKMVYLHVETGTQWLGSVVVNGHLINQNSYIHPFCPRLELNLTPYLKQGKNKIELWPQATIPSAFQVTGKVDTIEMPVDAIRIGIQ